MTELQLLTEKYKETMTRLEAQIVELRRKMDILGEASRLLEEEGLTADVTSGHECSSYCNLSA